MVYVSFSLFSDWLSGLTCTDENFVQKAGPTAFAKAEEEGVALIIPDTSPRGDDVPNDDAYDLGQGAYVAQNKLDDDAASSLLFHAFLTLFGFFAPPPINLNTITIPQWFLH